MTAADFSAKWDSRFADNTTFLIDEADFREFKDDLLLVFGLVGATTPVYVPGTTYTVGFLVRYTPQGGKEAFYYALNAGKLTAPGPGNLVDWKVVPGPVAATELWQPITWLAAQGIEGAGVQAGRKYQLDMGLDLAGKQQYVYLDGLDQYFDTTRGVLEVDGVRTAIEHIDLNAGTWQVAGTALGSGTVLRFVQHAEYNPVFSGTFTVDTNKQKMGSVVVAYLGPACTQPVLDPAIFRTKNAYVPGKTLEYCFKVSATGFIEYIITVLD